MPNLTVPAIPVLQQMDEATIDARIAELVAWVHDDCDSKEDRRAARLLIACLRIELLRRRL